MKIVTIILFISVIIAAWNFIFSVIDDFVFKYKSKKIAIDSARKEIVVENLIKVIRKDKSIRYVSIILDESVSKYRFVNFTKGHNHICKCEFETYKDAITDLKCDNNVAYWEYVE